MLKTLIRNARSRLAQAARDRTTSSTRVGTSGQSTAGNDATPGVESAREHTPADPLAGFLAELKRSVERQDQVHTDALVSAFRNFALDVEETLSPAQRGRSGASLELGTGIQSKQFMIDILPHIQAFIEKEPWGSSFSVLDVGAATGHGSNLLASMYARAELGYRMKVTALDINNMYRSYIGAACRYITFKNHNVFALTDTYDIVIASHVVEHVPEPFKFCRRLQECSRKVVFLAAPYDEPEDRLTKGHLHSIGPKFLEQLETTAVHLVESRAWGNFLCPPYKMFIAVLPGKATS